MKQNILRGRRLPLQKGTGVGDNSVESKSMLIVRRGNRIFSDAGAFGRCSCQLAPASVTIQLDQNHMLLTSGCNRIFFDTGAFGTWLEKGTGIGDNSVTSKSYDI
jgi:hypothetical protein